MLKIIDSIPEKRSPGGITRSSVEDDLLAFMNSGEQYCQITLKGVKGMKVTNRVREWLKRRNITHVHAETIDGTCYVTNDRPVRGGALREVV